MRELRGNEYSCRIEMCSLRKQRYPDHPVCIQIAKRTERRRPRRKRLSPKRTKSTINTHTAVAASAITGIGISFSSGNSSTVLLKNSS
jgi:hypothetical protein